MFSTMTAPQPHDQLLGVQQADRRMLAMFRPSQGCPAAVGGGPSLQKHTSPGQRSVRKQRMWTRHLNLQSAATIAFGHPSPVLLPAWWVQGCRW